MREGFELRLATAADAGAIRARPRPTPRDGAWPRRVNRPVGA